MDKGVSKTKTCWHWGLWLSRLSVLQSPRLDSHRRISCCQFPWRPGWLAREPRVPLLLLLGSPLPNLILSNIDSYIFTIWFATPNFSTFSITSHWQTVFVCSWTNGSQCYGIARYHSSFCPEAALVDGLGNSFDLLGEAVGHHHKPLQLHVIVV